mgnify:FL=1
MNNDLNSAVNWDEIWTKSDWIIDNFPSVNTQLFYNHHLKNLKKSTKILDIGCGNARNFIYLSELGFDVYGLDISKLVIKNNKKQFPKYKDKFLVSNTKDIEFQDNFFDVILSDASLYYQSKKNMIISVNEFFRVLKADGLIRVYTKSIKDNFLYKNDENISKEITIKQNHWEKNLLLTFLSLNDLKKMFVKFKNIKIGSEDFNFIDHKQKHSYWILTANK